VRGGRLGPLMPSHPTADEQPGPSARAAHIEFIAEWALPPGTLVRAEIDARGMTQADLAARAKLTEKHVSQVMTGTVSLTPDVALAFERSLGIPARTLLLAEARYQAERARQDAFTTLAKHEPWARRFPLADLKKKGVLRGTERGGELVDLLLRFFGVANPQAFETVSLAGISGFRRAQHLNVDEYATATWLRLGEQQTAEHQLHRYDPDRLRRSLPELRHLSTRPDGDAFREARQILAESGVALAFVDGIKGSRACGATRWVTPTRPLIVLSDRYGYRDTLWFSFLHEVGHILQHPRRCTFVNLADDGDDVDGLEAEANAFAAEVLVPGRYQERLLAATAADDFNALAVDAEIDVSILAGQRGHLTREWLKAQPLRKKLDVPLIARAAEAPLMGA
jgi:HTH-type transcriptional regulator/antitoxin HigA